MTRVTLLIAFVTFAGSTPTAAQESEVDAVRKVIVGESAALLQCDFDGWADHWWHEPYASLSSTLPERHLGLRGWSDIAAWSKRYTTDCVPNEMSVKRHDYRYRISEAMAFVTLLDNRGNESTRVLEKRNGQWKLIHVAGIGTTAYRGLAQRRELERMVGHWQADLSSLAYDRPVPFEVIELTLECKATTNGVTITVDWRHKQAGDSWSYTRKTELAYDTFSGAIGAFVVGNWTGGSSRIHVGKATHEDGYLSIESSPLSGPPNAYERRVYSWKTDDVLHMRTEGYDASGEPQLVADVDLRRNS